MVQNYSTPKRAGGVAQVVVCLPSKDEALSSNPSTEKKEDSETGYPAISVFIKRLSQSWLCSKRI
jgi:hypothetical protein